MVVLIVLCLGVVFLCCKAPYIRIHSLVKWVPGWPPIGKLAALSAYDMFS